jgi:HAD superfamily hydrolase (TIGR01484 family)
MEADFPRPLKFADLSRVEAVFTDVDGTLTSSNRLEARTVRALERLKESGVRLVLVTGRPVGWADCWIRTLPVDGAIAENGGVYLAWSERGRLRKVYAEPKRQRIRNRSRLLRVVAAAMKRVPGARLATDSPYTEVNIAIDYNEEARLRMKEVRALSSFLSRHGITVARSSVHLNCWIGRFDKLSTVRRFLRTEWGSPLRGADRRFVYVGDSLNDAPLFGAFALAVGVANAMDVLAEIEHPPRYLTAGREGRGFEEVAAAVIAQRKRSASPLRLVP